MKSPESFSRGIVQSDRIQSQIVRILRDMSEAYGIDLNTMPKDEVLSFVERAGITTEELDSWLAFNETVEDNSQSIQVFTPEEKTKINTINQKLRRFYESEYLQKMTQDEVEQNFK